MLKKVHVVNSVDDLTTIHNNCSLETSIDAMCLNFRIKLITFLCIW